LAQNAMNQLKCPAIFHITEYCSVHTKCPQTDDYQSTSTFLGVGAAQ
jgi:gamma-glutamyl phosphate reductase